MARVSALGSLERFLRVLEIFVQMRTCLKGLEMVKSSGDEHSDGIALIKFWEIAFMRRSGVLQDEKYLIAYKF